jgi:hypothetical protein
MKCKTENPGKGEFECLKEGRRVTRCARSVYVLHHFSIPMVQLRIYLASSVPVRDGHGHWRMPWAGQAGRMAGG